MPAGHADGQRDREGPGQAASTPAGQGATLPEPTAVPRQPPSLPHRGHDGALVIPAVPTQARPLPPQVPQDTPSPCPPHPSSERPEWVAAPSWLGPSWMTGLGPGEWPLPHVQAQVPSSPCGGGAHGHLCTSPHSGFTGDTLCHSHSRTRPTYASHTRHVPAWPRLRRGRRWQATTQRGGAPRRPSSVSTQAALCSPGLPEQNGGAPICPGVAQ